MYINKQLKHVGKLFIENVKFVYKIEKYILFSKIKEMY